MRRLATAAIVSLALAAAGTARAASFTYDLTQKVNGDTAAGTTVATIADIAPGKVQITMLPGLPSGQKVDTWLFNFNGSQADLNSLVFTPVPVSPDGGPAAASIGMSLNAYGGNSQSGYGNGKAGLFDIMFTFTSTGNSNNFYGGQKVVYDVTTTSSTLNLSALLFNTTSVGTGSNPGGYYSAVHIKGIPNANSGVMAANQSIPGVPEPASVAMALTSSLCLGLVALRRRGRSA